MRSSGRGPRAEGGRRRPDGRTRAARRVKALQAQFLAALGDIDETTVERVRTLAELTATAEAMRTKALGGDEVDLGALVKLENTVARARRELLAAVKRKPAPTALAEYLARRASAS
jgi:hypothetical protein